MPEANARGPRSAVLPLFLVFFALVGLWTYWLRNDLGPRLAATRERLDAIDRRLERIEGSLALLHFDRNPEGEPLDAILAFLEFWSDREQRYGSSLVERPLIEEKLRLGKNALAALGPSAYRAVERAFFDHARDPARTPLRKRLLEVLVELDPGRGKDLCARLLETPGRNPQIRTLAARLLTDLDPELAGAKLRKVILSETYRGVRHRMPNPAARDLPPGASFEGYPGFFNLVDLYLKTADPQKGDVLLVVLENEGHDVATLQSAIGGLEERGDPSVVPRLQKLFESPRSFAQQNPLFRRRLAHAIMRLAGSSACDWLKLRFAREADEGVRRVLGQLLKMYCG